MDVSAITGVLDNVVLGGVIIGVSFLAVVIMLVGFGTLWNSSKAIEFLKSHFLGIVIGGICIFAATALAALIRSLIG